MKKMRERALKVIHRYHLASCAQEVSAYPECPADKCKVGHDWTPENTYIGKNGVRQCRKCQASRRKLKRHATGESKKFNTTAPSLYAVVRAAIKAFRILDAWDGSKHLDGDQQNAITEAWHTLGDALNWPKGTWDWMGGAI